VTSDLHPSNPDNEIPSPASETTSPREASRSRDEAAAQAAEPGKDASENGDASVEDQLRAEAARLKDQLLRLAADFDNYRKRSRREISDAERMAREELLRELLPVFDNLERASQHAAPGTDVQSIWDGIMLVNRQFIDTLARLGVERIKTVGQAFDPSVHEAVQQVETADQPPGAVCAEVLGGYRFGDRLIRPAMVVVAKALAQS